MLTKDPIWFKAISISRLNECLRQFPNDSLVTISPVRDLLILNTDEKEIGFISLSDEIAEDIDMIGIE